MLPYPLRIIFLLIEIDGLALGNAIYINEQIIEGVTFGTHDFTNLAVRINIFA